MVTGRQRSMWEQMNGTIMNMESWSRELKKEWLGSPLSQLSSCHEDYGEKSVFAHPLVKHS